MNRWMYIVPALAFLVIAAFLFVGLNRARERPPNILPSVLIDKPAPPIALGPMDALTPGFTRADLAQGHVTVVNFFASWCIPCRAEHPVLEAMHRQGIEVIGIAYKDKPEATLKFLDQLGDPYERIGTDQDGRTGIDWGITGVPETYVLDKSGIVRFWQRAPLSEADAARIAPLMQALAK